MKKHLFPFEKEKYSYICQDFDEQLDLAEQFYGNQIRFYYGEKEIDKLLLEEPFYPEETKRRVKIILMNQRRKYRYLFGKRS